jgi:hypothetical protein
MAYCRSRPLRCYPPALSPWLITSPTTTFFLSNRLGEVSHPLAKAAALADLVGSLGSMRREIYCNSLQAGSEVSAIDGQDATRHIRASI